VERYADTRGDLAETLQRSGYRAAVAAPVTVGGELWGALAAGTRSDEPLPAGVEQQLCDFADLVAQALANADAREQLAASRARIVEAGDAERRRLERNLHDGAQARLVGLAMLLGLARRRVDTDPEETGILIDRALVELRASLAELRELARGIHPAILTELGLAAALNAIASRAPVPVTLETDGEQRLPAPVEVAAYFVVAEALANVAKYAQATEATVAVHRTNGQVTVDVSDDGIGGADAAQGSGLRGLGDRVAALDGTLSLDSPPGHGTRLHVEIPCAPLAGPA
jgi:signal transduction histidine kinase